MCLYLKDSLTSLILCSVSVVMSVVSSTLLLFAAVDEVDESVWCSTVSCGEAE